MFLNYPYFLYFHTSNQNNATMKKTLALSLILLAAMLLQPVLAQNPKILVFGKTKGFYHTSIPKGMITIMQVCSQNGITADTTRDAAAFTAENLKQYLAVVFLNTTGDVLNNTQQEVFTSYIRAGGGFLGVHAATDTEYDWPWYNKLVGAYFLSHPAQQDAVIKVTDRNNPATSGLPAEWKRNDEWYNFKNIHPDIRVLAYLDESTYKGGANGEKHPFIWCHEFEGGRSMYTGVGHREDNYDEPLLQLHLLGAIQWVTKIK
jgi:type 1 glutamine amidotransferase